MTLLKALGEAYELERTLSKLYRAEASLADDIGRTFPIRLFRQGRREGAEPVLGAALDGISRALRHETRLPETMLRFDRAFERALRPQAKHGVAMKALKDQYEQWRSIRKALQDRDREGTEELVAWLDRDIEERLEIARTLGGREKARAATELKKGRVASETGATRKLKAAEKAIARDAKKRAREAREVYEAFADAAARSKPDNFPAFNKLAAYFKHDDPIWNRIAEKVAAHRAGKDTGEVAHAIQGVIGEALALRNAWVVDSIVKATEQAQRIASKLGKDWDVVFCQMPVTASTRGGGMGEIYDASVWIVRKGSKEPLDAAPVFVLQVKSGTTRTAAQQTATDFRRELGDRIGPTVWLPGAVDGAGSAPRKYAMNNLRALVSQTGTPREAAELTTQRMLVSPRAPSTDSIVKNLPEGTSIEYLEGLMSKSELNTISQALRDQLRKR